jgi:hypothetical protein
MLFPGQLAAGGVVVAARDEEEFADYAAAAAFFLIKIDVVRSVQAKNPVDGMR